MESNCSTPCADEEPETLDVVHVSVFSLRKKIERQAQGYKAPTGRVTKRFMVTDYGSKERMQKAIAAWKRSYALDNKAIEEGREPGYELQYTKRLLPGMAYSPKFYDDLDIVFDKNGPQQTSTVLIGSSKSGKSTLLAHLHRKYYSGPKYITTLFSENMHIPLYHDFNLKCGIFDKMGERYIMLEQNINKQTRNKYWFCNCFDDIIDNKYSAIFNKLVLSYRNANMSTIVSLQYSKLMSKANRSSVNNIVIFRCNSMEGAEDIVRMYLKTHLARLGIKPGNEQMEFFRKVTEDHGFIYLNPVTDTISFHRLGEKYIKELEPDKSESKSE